MTDLLKDPIVHRAGEKPFKCGFVAVVGLPNAGKSTLINRLVGQKVSIVTPRPQTTRNRIQGILNRPDAQVILIDTPGIHRPASALGRQMMQEADAAFDAVDVLALMIDSNGEFGRDAMRAMERCAQFDGTRFLLLNKIDRIPKTELLPLIEKVGKLAEFAEIIPLSALTGDGVDLALEKFIEFLPVAEPHFPIDQYTDQPERFLAAEIVREKTIMVTFQEVPYAVAVLVDGFEESPRLIRIRATLYVEQEGQKGILIGRGGATLKQIGTAARKELETILDTKVFLELYVKVQRNWRDNPQLVRQFDWHQQLDQMFGKSS